MATFPTEGIFDLGPVMLCAFIDLLHCEKYVTGSSSVGNDCSFSLVRKVSGD